MRAATKALLISIAIGLTVGCAHKPEMTLDQLDAALAKNKQASTRVYPVSDIEKVRGASQKVLVLLDPPDMKFDVRDSELLATRFSTYYAVFSFGFGRDWYSISMKKTLNGVQSTFGLEGQMLGGLPPAIPVSFKSDIPVSAHSNPADFKLFHDRVEFLLGLREKWPTCDEAKKSQADPESNMMMCDLIGLENLSPESESR